MMTYFRKRRCSMKYWTRRYVGVDFDHRRPCLSSVAQLLCQARSKHTATCVSGQSFLQKSHSPCSSCLPQWSLFEILAAAWTLLIYSLGGLVLCVILKRRPWRTRVDMETPALICVASPPTSRDEGFHADEWSHALRGKLLSLSRFITAKVRQESLNDAGTAK